MKKRLFMLLLIYGIIATARSQNITSAEYFFDADPGRGNGTAISVGTVGDIVNFSASIPTTSLGAGFHFLGLRVKDANGVWGLFEKRGFYLSQSTSDVGNITSAEYFFDADPGRGNGTPLSVGTPGATVNFTAAIPESLTAGFHFLAIRVKDADGKWGLFEKRGFYISSSTTDVGNIVVAEYFFDADPGLGNGTSLSVGSPGATVNFTVNIPEALTAGFHFLAIRVKDADGKWGLFEKRGFYISSSATDVANITAAEYFFDADPGVGNGTAVSVGASGSVVNFTPVIPTSLSSGFHFLAIRVKDANGKWGLFEKRGFYVSTTTTDVTNIVAAEYFINTDPGVGNGTPLTITTPGGTINETWNIPVTGLPEGAYRMVIRLKDAQGKWGLYQDSAFSIGNSTITCHTDTTVNTAIGECSKIVNGLDPVVFPPQAFDYVLTGATTGSGNGTASGLTFNAGITTVTYKLTNIPSKNCSFNVTVTALPPIITTDPVSQAICAGGNVTFSTLATGSNLNYQWRKNGSSISGANAALFTINGLVTGDAGNYDVIVSTNCNTKDTSAIAVLTVNTPPVITVQPSNQTVCQGTNVTFNVTATGTSLTYQWRKGGVNINGATSSSYTIIGVATANAGNYDVVISGICPPSPVTSNTVTLTVNTPPVITVQPSSQTVCQGTNVTFNVTATGTSLTYQWRKGGVNISGATSSSYTINSVTTGDAGNYDVVVSGICPPTPAISNSVTLTVNTPPVITVQPVNQTVCQGTNVTFNVTATGTSLTYQWRKGGVNISGATSSSYTINGVATTDAGSYDVVVSGICPPTPAISNSVSLTVNTPPVITVQPANQTICVGGNVTFNVTATGTSLTYQWRKGGVNISGANGSSYTINGVTTADAGSYDVVVSGICPPTPATSNSVTLTVNTPPAISVQPVSQSICPGGNVTFSVTASGTAITYQWRKGGVNISGATSSSYSINGVVAGDAASYDVVITGTCGTLTSNAASLTVFVPTAISVNPVSQTICAGNNVTFTVSASGQGTLSYQWKKNGVNISGAVSSSYTITGALAGDAGNYTVDVTAICGTITSTVAVLTVNPLTVITTQPTNLSGCIGSSVTFTVTATGTGVLTYQWKKNGVDISGATSSSFTINPVAAGDAATYTVVVTGGCGSVTSNGASLTVTSNTVINTEPTNQSSCLGGSVTFTVSASGSGTLTYQWKKNGVDISGATSASYTISSVTAGDAANYSVAATSSCGTVLSNTASLSIIPATVITAQPANQVTCLGTTASFSVSATGNNLTYQWRKGGVNISGATSSSYSIVGVAALDVGNYDVVVTGTCGSVSSNSVSLALGNVVINTQPLLQTVCAGANVTFSVSAAGSSITYQWRKDGANINGATSSSYTINGTTTGSAGSYDVIVTGFCDAVTSAPATLTINTSPAIITQPSNQSVCPGSGVTFNVSATGTNLTYQWRKGGANISGATSSSYTINSVAPGDAGNYDVIVSGTCAPNATSAAATLTVLQPPGITTHPLTQITFVGSSVTFTVVATGSGLTYQWRKGGVNIPGAINNSYTITGVALTDAGNYDVVVSGTCPPSVTSNAAVLTVSTVSISTQPQNQSVCDGSNASFTIVANGTNLTYQWQLSTSGGPFTNISGATAASFTLNAVTTSQSGNQYRCVVSGSVNSNAATLTVNPLPVVALNLPFDTLYKNSPQQTLSGGTPSGGVYSGTGVSGTSILPGAFPLGNYSISYRYTDANGCSATAGDAFAVIPATSQVNVFPNPAQDGSVTIVVSGELVGGKATAYNGAGQKVGEWTVAGRYNKQQFKWAAGTYTLVFRKGNTQAFKVLIITR